MAANHAQQEKQLLAQDPPPLRLVYASMGKITMVIVAQKDTMLKMVNASKVAEQTKSITKNMIIVDVVMVIKQVETAVFLALREAIKIG